MKPPLLFLQFLYLSFFGINNIVRKPSLGFKYTSMVMTESLFLVVYTNNPPHVPLYYFGMHLFKNPLDILLICALVFPPIVWSWWFSLLSFLEFQVAWEVAWLHKLPMPWGFGLKGFPTILPSASCVTYQYESSSHSILFLFCYVLLMFYMKSLIHTRAHVHTFLIITDLIKACCYFCSSGTNTYWFSR